MCDKLNKIFVLLLLCFGVFFPKSSVALPWDTDMNVQESYKANEMARSPAKGTVPLGAVFFPKTAEEAQQKLSNPEKFNLHSVWAGKRLWKANCFTCHGEKGDGQGVVGKQMSVPSLLTDFYRGRSDPQIYFVIQNGGANMPRYGFKFSEKAKWDLVNYLRFLQGQDVNGMKRPQ